jgi:hypothetical protein
MPSPKSVLLLSTLLPLTLALPAAESAAPLGTALSSPPGWVVQSALTVKETYDGNAYLQSMGAQADVPTFVTGLLLAANGDFTVSKDMKAALNYSADYNAYHAASSETFTRHTGGLKLTATEGDWSHVFTGGIVIVDGDKVGPTYTGAGGAPALGGPERMLRRAQQVYSAGYTASYTHGNVLFRPLLTWKYQHYGTDQRATAGYQNFATRDEGTYGFDLGWKSNPKLTTYVGYRLGHQTQDNLLGVVNNYTNSLSRVLVGFEGAFAPWCKASVQLGEDFRDFGNASVALTDKKKTKFYSNSTLTFAPTKADTITLAYVRFLQPAFTGRNAYEDITGEVQYRRTLDASWAIGLGAKVVNGFYEIGNRRDSLYFYSFSAGYRIDARSALTVDGQVSETGTKVRNHADTSGRTYSRELVSVGYRLSL